MSKRYYYRRSKRTYPKQKWQITYVNPAPINLTSSSPLAANSFWAKHQTICQSVVPTNSAGASVVSANNIVKVANFKVKGSFNAGTGTDASYFTMIIYVIFVPQGIQPDNIAVSNDNLATSIFYSHPEWVMGWTRVDCDTQGSDHFTISSRLRRNLNSGDQVVLGVLIMNSSSTSSSSFSVTVRATAQYCARAN